MQYHIKGLRAFQRIMRHGTLREAAKELYTSESALSRQLTLFEQELGLSLFLRENRRLIPTDQAIAFYDEAERILHALEQLPKIAQDIRELPKRRLRVVATHRVADSIAVPAITEFCDAHPQERISLELHQIKFLERYIAANQFDIGIGAIPVRHHDIDVERLCQIPAVVLVRAGHPLTKKKNTGISIDELHDQKLILPASGTIVRNVIDNLFDKAGFAPKELPIQVSHSRIAGSMVLAGAGISLCDALICHSFGDDLVAVPLKQEGLLEFGLLFPASAKPIDSVQVLADIIRKHANAVSEEFNYLCSKNLS